MKRLHLFFVMTITAILLFAGCSGRIALNFDVARGIEKVMGIDDSDKAKMGSVVISPDGETALSPIDNVIVTRDDSYVFTILQSGMPQGYTFSRAEYNFNSEGWKPMKLNYYKHAGGFKPEKSRIEPLRKSTYHLLQVRAWFVQEYTVIDEQAIPIEKKTEFGPYTRNYRIVYR